MTSADPSPVEQVLVRRGVYHDSVTLLRVSQAAAAVPGITAAQVAMATPLNLELADALGFPAPPDVGPNDLLITVRGADDDAVRAGLDAIEQALAARVAPARPPGGTAPARTVRLWPATRDLLRDTETLIRGWDEELAARTLADNIDFDRPIARRRAAIAELIEQIGPLRERSDQQPDVLSAETPADVTWSIPGARGELICSIHLTPTRPAQLQELEVAAAAYTTPRSGRPTDVSRKARRGVPLLSSVPNTRVVWPQ